MGIECRMAFVEDPDFLEEFTSCGLSDDDLEQIQCVITVSPMRGDVVPVSDNIRDVVYECSTEKVVIRYAYLPPPASTVLLLMAYSGDESYSMTVEEATEAELYIARQLDFFSTRYTK